MADTTTTFILNCRILFKSFVSLKYDYITYTSNNRPEFGWYFCHSATFQEFLLCRMELDDPRACISEGKAVTNCAMNFFRKVKKSCSEEFMQYATCLDKSSSLMSFNLWVWRRLSSIRFNFKWFPVIIMIKKLSEMICSSCRVTQGVFDKCMKDNLDMDRPHYGYFTRAKVFQTITMNRVISGRSLPTKFTFGLDSWC